MLNRKFHNDIHINCSVYGIVNCRVNGFMNLLQCSMMDLGPQHYWQNLHLSQSHVEMEQYIPLHILTTLPRSKRSSAELPLRAVLIRTV